jgi:hypothetical protein
MDYININDQPLKPYYGLPTLWQAKGGYNYAPPEVVYVDGFRELINPEFDATTHKLGSLIFDETKDIGSYEVLEKTSVEIQAEKLQKLESRKAELISVIAADQALVFAQEVDTRNEMAAIAEIYPMWEPTGETITAGTKLNGYDGDGEIVLYKCNQNIAATPQYEPRLAVYAFDKIIYHEGYMVFQQPQSHTLYQVGDIVWFPKGGDVLYKNKVANNGHSPSAAPNNWEIFNAGNYE